MDRDLGCLSDFLGSTGPLGLVVLETTGSEDSRSSQIFELGAILLDDPRRSPQAFHSLFRTEGKASDVRLARAALDPEEWASAPELSEWRAPLVEALSGRTLIVQAGAEVRRLLARDVSSGLARTQILDIEDLLALTHPDVRAEDSRDPVRGLLIRAPNCRALKATTALLDVLLAVAKGSDQGELRYLNARRALDRQRPDSPWLGILAPGEPLADGAEESR